MTKQENGTAVAEQQTQTAVITAETTTVAAEAAAPVAPSHNIYAAIAMAQAEIGGVVAKDRLNSYLNVKFASFASITQLAIPAFAKQGLAVLVENWRDADGLVVRTILAMSDSARTHIDICIPIPSRKDGSVSPQEIGIALSYGRRYGILALAGLAEGDDDGMEVAQQQSQQPRQQQRQPQRQAPQQRGQQQRPAPAQRPQPQQAAQKSAPKQAQQAPTQEQLLDKALKTIKECSLERLDGAEQWVSAQLQGENLEMAIAALAERRKELESASTTSA